tara:strand:- start:123 stop:404 length:282 start_codon:yes stop_codon:yes gene_type:complete
VISNYPAAKIINDTSVHIGRFGKVSALQDSVISIGKDFDSVASVDAVSDFDTISFLPYFKGDQSLLQLKAGAEFFGVFTSVFLDSGTVIVYRL